MSIKLTMRECKFRSVLIGEAYYPALEQCFSSVAYWEGGFGVFKPPPKFRRYRRSPRSHEQEEPASRFPFQVHCVLIRL